jgi:geranylgeranyl reductase family protein
MSLQASQIFDVIIIGAGPAGSACAIELAKAAPHVRIALLEKGVFPKDKICGDALSPDVINQVKMLSDDLANKLDQSIHALPVKGVRIFGRKKASYPYFFNERNFLKSYTCPRLHLDSLLFEHTRLFPNISFHGNHEVKDVQAHEEGVVVQTATARFEGKMVLGADGAHSVVARRLGRIVMDKDYHAGGLRVYYEGVRGLAENLIELHFMPEVLPGYLWIFPLPEGRANVGLGMTSRQISKDNIHLRERLQHILEHHPVMKERFAAATAMESVKGFGLPLGGKSNSISGQRYLLLGDAASLIDPLTGEGIGNAIRSGRVAAEHFLKCLTNNDFSAQHNRAYDQEIYRRMMPEFKLDYRIRQLIYFFPASIDLFVYLACKMKGFRTNLMDYYIRFHKFVSRSR